MADIKHNLLTDALISIGAGSTKSTQVSLPAVLAALARGEPLEFATLQPHQYHPWHAFMVQLGALAAFHVSAAKVEAVGDDVQWTEALRALTTGDEPWCLIVSDVKVPAFMQPPVGEGSLTGWNEDNVTSMPDAIDLLETAKNHDVKRERIAAPRPEHWLYALVALQTMQGYSGRDNYGIARMNGGVSNRPAFAAARNLGWSTRFRRDTNLLLNIRSKIAIDKFDIEAGVGLLWLEPWNGVEQISVQELDPFFIEICRRIRLVEEQGRILARWTTTKAPRIAAKELKGNLGDPWVPIDRKEGMALTATDFNYQLIQKVMFGPDFVQSPASIPQPEDADEPLLLCQIFIRGQGKTNGYHERLIPVPPKARGYLATEDGRLQLGELSKKRLDEIKTVTKKTLRPALAALLQGGAEKLDFRDPRIDAFLKPFDRDIDLAFFAELFEDVDLTLEAARLKWLHRLLAFARQAFDQAKHSVPVPSARIFRAHAVAERLFAGASRRLRLEAGESIEQKEA